MKRGYLFIYIATLLSIVGCVTTRKSEPTMFVSIAPLKPIVEQIVGDDFKVEVLVPAGAAPELFEPTPRQQMALNDAQLIFGTGLLDFEQALLGRIKHTSRVVNLSQGIELIAGECCHAHHAHHHHAHGVDPHIWCSPKSLQKMAENAYHAIRTTLPDSLHYGERYTALCERLLELDEEVTEMCSNSPHSYFIIFHPALTYLARDYGIEQVALERDGNEPSLKYLTAVIERARRDGIRRIYYQATTPHHHIETISRDLGATAIEIDPLAEDIFTNIREITRSITE